MESKSARRRSRQANSSACEEVSIAQQSLDKVLRLEGRLGTLHEKFIESTNEMVELRDRIDVLQKILLFIDVDKLNVAIKALKIDAVAEVDECFDLNVAIKALKIDAVAEVDPCFETPPKPLKLQLDNIITPEKPRTLLKPFLGHSELKSLALDKLLETSSISSAVGQDFDVESIVMDSDDDQIKMCTQMILEQFIKDNPYADETVLDGAIVQSSASDNQVVLVLKSGQYSEYSIALGKVLEKCNFPCEFKVSLMSSLRALLRS